MHAVIKKEQRIHYTLLCMLFIRGDTYQTLK